MHCTYLYPVARRVTHLSVIRSGKGTSEDRETASSIREEKLERGTHFKP